VRRILPLLAALLVLSGVVSAWGPATQRFICDEAVEAVWGQATVAECLPKKSSKFLEEYCEHLYSIKGADVYVRCKNSYQRRDFVHPANIVDEFFNDTEFWHDYSQCPIRPGPGRYLICGSKDDAPAPREAQRWFDIAGNESDTCTRVYDFCIGAAYYAKAGNPLNQIVGEEDDCYKKIVDGVEGAIISRKGSFRVSESKCEFKHSDYTQEIVVTDRRIKDIISSLVEIGEKIPKKTIELRGKVVLLANSVDSELNRGFIGSLKSEGIEVAEAKAEEFTTLRYADCVIVLGGHHSPEGVGEVADTLLYSDEKENISLKEGAKLKAVRENVWTLKQKIFLLAGHEKEDTRDAVKEYGDELINELKACV
jgi:hypothetical protein